MELYRAKKNGEWIYGGVYDTISDAFFDYLVVEENGELRRVVVDDFTRCRYTGFSVNDVKIFDKDILKLEMPKNNDEMNIKFEITIVIDSSQSYHLNLLEQATHIEILGNSIENQDLVQELFQ